MFNSIDKFNNALKNLTAPSCKEIPDPIKGMLRPFLGQLDGCTLTSNVKILTPAFEVQTKIQKYHENIRKILRLQKRLRLRRLRRKQTGEDVNDYLDPDEAKLKKFENKKFKFPEVSQKKIDRDLKLELNQFKTDCMGDALQNNSTGVIVDAVINCTTNEENAKQFLQTLLPEYAKAEVCIKRLKENRTGRNDFICYFFKRVASLINGYLQRRSEVAAG